MPATPAIQTTDKIAGESHQDDPGFRTMLDRLTYRAAVEAWYTHLLRRHPRAAKVLLDIAEERMGRVALLKLLEQTRPVLPASKHACACERANFEMASTKSQSQQDQPPRVPDSSASTVGVGS